MSTMKMWTTMIVLTSLVCIWYVSSGPSANEALATSQAITADNNDDSASSLPDFDGDGTIGFGDFVIFAVAFGSGRGDEGYDARFDLNGDGEVEFLDFVIFAQDFGRDVPSPAVSIPDANLRAAIEAALGKAASEPITQAEMATLDSLEASDAGISDLTGLEHATSLTWLDLSSNNVTNIAVLEGLAKLKGLNLADNKISDLTSLVSNKGLGSGDKVDVTDNPLNAATLSLHIPALQARGVRVSFVPSPLVTIRDANLRAAIWRALDKASGTPITVADLEVLPHLNAPESGIGDLTGLESAINLTYLYLSGNNITDLSPLAGLTNLTGLYLRSNNIRDLSPLAGLTNLTNLNFWDNDIRDLSPLAGLTNLTNLNFWDNDIRDLSPLVGLTNLTDLDLWNNNIRDLSPLAGLTNLTYLHLSGNNIRDLSPLAGLTNLTALKLWNNNIGDLSPLAGLTNLANLHLSGNNITDLSPLAGLTNLTDLDLFGNNITDLSPLAGLTNLTLLVLSSNNITDLSPLAGLTNLTLLVLSNNNITDLSPLAGLTNLTLLRLWNNSVTDLSPLAGLTNLTLLNLGINDLTDVSALGGLVSLTELNLNFNRISDISALADLTGLTRLNLRGNPLSDTSVNVHIPALESRGAEVRFDSFDKGDYDIELVFLSRYTERQKNVIQYAARRWMAIIREDVPDYEFTEGWSGSCGGKSFRISSGEKIDDLRIYIGSSNIAYGSTSILRAGTRLPVIGCMAFNASIDWLLDLGLHEIGHVLGFGSFWVELGYLRALDGDTHFNGPLATAAFNEAGGVNYHGAKVPVSQSGIHWRSGVFHEEIMSGAVQPISAITVQSLADLGYGVDVNQADAYTLPLARAGAKIAAASPSMSVPGADFTRANARHQLYGDQDVHGEMPEPLPPVVGHARWRRRLESAVAVWRSGLDFRFDRQTGRLAPPVQVETELTCGAGLRQEPIYVVDPQGRVIRTIVR